MKKKVLITGASGFVGYHLITEALAAGLEVYAALRPSSNVKHLEGLPIQYVNLDFSSVDALKQEIEEKKYPYIIHAAGITKAKTTDIYNKVNAEYSRNLAQAAMSLGDGLEKFVFVSSLAAMGPLKDLSGEIEELSSARPVMVYPVPRALASYTKLPLLSFTRVKPRL